MGSGSATLVLSFAYIVFGSNPAPQRRFYSIYRMLSGARSFSSLSTGSIYLMLSKGRIRLHSTSSIYRTLSWGLIRLHSTSSIYRMLSKGRIRLHNTGSIYCMLLQGRIRFCNTGSILRLLSRGGGGWILLRNTSAIYRTLYLNYSCFLSSFLLSFCLFPPAPLTPLHCQRMSFKFLNKATNIL